MTMTKTRQIEFVAALKIPTESTVAIDEIAARFEEATIEAISPHPAVGAYFVQAMSDLNEVHVGLRFENVSVDNIEEWAEEILTEAVNLFKRGKGLGRAANLKREDSSLVVG